MATRAPLPSPRARTAAGAGERSWWPGRPGTGGATPPPPGTRAPPPAPPPPPLRIKRRSRVSPRNPSKAFFGKAFDAGDEGLSPSDPPPTVAATQPVSVPDVRSRPGAVRALVPRRRVRHRVGLVAVDVDL